MRAIRGRVWGARAILVGMLVTFIGFLGLPTDSSKATTFPGINGDIAFVQILEGGSMREIYLVGRDGMNPRRLIEGDNPSWDPSGRIIAFEDDLRIHTVAASDGHQRGTIYSCYYDRDPSWPGTGRSEIAVNQRYGKVDRFALIGRNQEDVSLGSGVNDTSIEWAPDGSALVYSADGTIVEVMPEGERLGVFGGLELGYANPAYSSDSSKIIFNSDRDGDEDIYVMDRDGSDLVKLTDDPASDTDPAFSPDGTKIVFVSNRAGGSHLFVMLSDGTEVTQLTTGPGIEFSPDWGPNPGESPSPVPIATQPPPPSCETTHTRTVDLRLKGHLTAITQTLSDGCPVSPSVILQRRNFEGRWRAIRRIYAEESRESLPDRPGRYRAVLREVRHQTYVSRHVAVCTAAVSTTVRHRHQR